MVQKNGKVSFHWRSFVSFLLTLSFVVMVFSGLVLYLAPSGGQARRAGWQFWLLGRDGWMAQHLTASTVFLVVSIFHLYFNYRALLSYIRNKAQKGLRRPVELAAALLIAVFLVAGTVAELPPWSYILQGSKHLRQYKKEAAEGKHHGSFRQAPTQNDSESD